MLKKIGLSQAQTEAGTADLPENLEDSDGVVAPDTEVKPIRTSEVEEDNLILESKRESWRCKPTTLIDKDQVSDSDLEFKSQRRGKGWPTNAEEAMRINDP